MALPPTIVAGSVVLSVLHLVELATCQPAPQDLGSRLVGLPGLDEGDGGVQ